MRDCVIITDTHLGSHKFSDIWHNVTFNFFKNVIDTCVRKNVKTILHLGDWHDTRKQINILTLAISYEILDMIEDAGLELIIVLGNHDIYYKDSSKIHSLMFFELFDNVKIIDSTTELDDSLLAPWLYNPAYIKSSEYKYLFGHLEINGFNIAGSTPFKGANLEYTDLENYDLVLTGHFHTPSTKGNIIYMGAPYHLTFNDVGSVRGYYTLINDKLEFVLYDDAPKYVKLFTDNKIVPSTITGNVVKLIFDRDYGKLENEKLIDEIQMHNPMELTVDFSNINVIASDLKLEDIQVKDNKEILLEYIDKLDFPENLKRNVMNKLIDKLIIGE